MGLLLSTRRAMISRGDYPWWDPRNRGLSVIGAYQARSVPNYATSLVNLANPGTYDLVEGNGAVPWTAAGGWAFVAASTQYFSQNGTPTTGNGWSAFIQFASVTNNGYIFGASQGAGRILALEPGVGVRYSCGGTLTQGPVLLTGNLGMANQTAYRNGVSDGAIGPWTNTGPWMAIGARNNFGAPGGYVEGNIYAVCFYNAGGAAVAAEAPYIVAAMAAL